MSNNEPVYIFTKRGMTSEETKHPKNEVVYKIYDDAKPWPDMVEDFLDFLNGCGYEIDNDDRVRLFKILEQSEGKTV